MKQEKLALQGRVAELKSALRASVQHSKVSQVTGGVSVQHSKVSEVTEGSSRSACCTARSVRSPRGHQGQRAAQQGQ